MQILAGAGTGRDRRTPAASWAGKGAAASGRAARNLRICRRCRPIMMDPLVSIVLATWNGERFLAAQLDSLLAQTYPHLEIVAIDDCSSDSTPDILDRYARADSRIRVVRNERNLGYQKNFERGFMLARGDYIAPCDQDDVWAPNKIAVLVANRGEYGIVYCDSEFIDARGALLGQRMSDWKELADFDDPINYAVGGSVSGHAMLIKREVLHAALPIPGHTISHDYWLGFVATLHGPMKFVREPLVFYRRHDSNVFGALRKHGSRKKRHPSRAERDASARVRMRLLYDKCPESRVEAKRFYATLLQSYASYSLGNNLMRARTFLSYRNEILAFKRRGALRRVLYALKMFFKLV